MGRVSILLGLLYSRWCIDTLVFSKTSQDQVTYLFSFFDNREIFHDQALKTLHGDPNLGVLTTSQLGKFKVWHDSNPELCATYWDHTSIRLL